RTWTILTSSFPQTSAALGPLWCRSQAGRQRRVPHDPPSSTVAAKMDQRMDLAAVQVVSRVVQALDRVAAVAERQGVVHPRRPAFLGKSRENQFLVARRLAVTLDQQRAETQFPPLLVPARTCRPQQREVDDPFAARVEKG